MDPRDSINAVHIARRLLAIRARLRILGNQTDRTLATHDRAFLYVAFDNSTHVNST